ncbi:hypothetical protein BLNAU_16841 [Blattamonas nauphoetae]|uniref:Uncharacterized protein n=1 Tax=Blattamonas nauphoetae TaxID=2049346 RepID=A0ABQ9XC37_9EUKA|nr:hypothetical protein BLNAU_16841 [Blattamonas nauphoetae]
MLPDPTSNDFASASSQRSQSTDLNTYFLDVLSAYRRGTEKEKVSILTGVRNRIEEDENESRMKEVSEMGLRVGFVSELCRTLVSECSLFLFTMASTLLTLLLTCLSFPNRMRMSSLLPSLLSLTQNSDPTLSVPATHAVGLVCGSCLTCGDVEGVLSGGVVERVCEWASGERDEEEVVGLLGVLDSLCVGLKKVIREEKSRGRDAAGGGKGEKGDEKWSVVSRCWAALALVENTLLGLCWSEERAEEEEERVGVRGMAGAMLAVHFAHVLRRTKREVGVIGVDVGRVRREMEERDQEREKEIKRQEEERRKEYERMMEEVKRNEEERKEENRKEREERRKEHERTMEELRLQMEKNKRFIEIGAEREREIERLEAEMKRQNKMGAAAIEWFPSNGYTLSGSAFTRTGGSHATLLSSKFGKVVVRFTFIFKQITSCTMIGLVGNPQLDKVKSGTYFASLPDGGGWDMYPGYQHQEHKGIELNRGSACACGKAGQRVVLEADGRDGKRTLRLSQDGQTQPSFFSNIHIPFRFALIIYGSTNGVSIESVEVVKEPTLVGGTMEVRMD